eukprot:gnl/Chilomastix_cuspidata/228.p1 GENE.gnl/Chilomastix_cuspidata/228~~gnl/Chilomastix_cuspidata/228.p1  ORF type:complete len:753 (+),score=232.75 gnl/Chilomastix_cuspidata/228:41-2299(+)
MMAPKPLSKPPAVGSFSADVPRELMLSPESVKLTKVFEGPGGLSFVGELKVIDKRMKQKYNEPIFVKQIGKLAIMDICRHYFKLSSRSILSPLGFVTVDDKPSAVFPLCAHRNLASYLRERPNMSSAAQIWLSHQLCNALNDLHAARIVFGNLTPETVLIRNPNELVLMNPFTVAPKPKEKGMYSPPELHHGETLSYASDAFSFGLILVSLATEGALFVGMSEEDATAKILAGEVPPVPISSPLYPVVNGLVKLDPAERMSLSEAQRILSGALAASSASIEKGSNERFKELEESVAGLVAAIDELNEENRRLVKNNNRLTRSLQSMSKRRKDMEKELADIRKSVDLPRAPHMSITADGGDESTPRLDTSIVEPPRTQRRGGQLDDVINDLKARMDAIESPHKGMTPIKTAGKPRQMPQFGSVHLTIPQIKAGGKKSLKKDSSGAFLPPIPLEAKDTDKISFFTALKKNRVPGFFRTLMKKTVHNMDGLHISDPVVLKKIPVDNFLAVTAAVSCEGVLCFYSWHTKKLFLYNLFTENAMEIGGFASYAFLAVFEERVYLGELKSEVVLHASIADLFTKGDVATFERMTVPKISSTAAYTDRAVFTGEIFYNSRNALVKLNLSSGEFTELFIDGGIHYIASTTSIAIPGVRIAVDTHDGRFLYKIAHGETEKEVIGDLKGEVLTLLPSTKDTSDLKNAAWINYSREVHYRGKTIALEKHVRPLLWHSLVRIYRDAFILFDEMRQQWVVCRIWVD